MVLKSPGLSMITFEAHGGMCVLKTANHPSVHVKRGTCKGRSRWAVPVTHASYSKMNLSHVTLVEPTPLGSHVSAARSVSI